ncbi:hypothetical protein [Butyrivibrio sp. AC2005]|uniref:hypothetical protein n=1 Tax=Butyrivibrio sp. AC2005 TaxID=1280672 RepID=UPI00041A7079|nr:hypothetical protein [Butyrivibrio sp. AC2005]
MKTVFDEYNENKDAIANVLHEVEQEKMQLDIEVGTTINCQGVIVDVTYGDKHSVFPPHELLKDRIFTHNHPTGRCFSRQDIKSAVLDGLLECRVSTPQGTYFSLKRKSDAAVSLSFINDAWNATGSDALSNRIMELIKSGEIFPTDLTWDVRARIENDMMIAFLREHASEYGFIYSEGGI